MTPIAPAVPPAARHFYRCLGCLAVFAVEGKRHGELRCACGGPTTWMGQVHRTRLQKTEERCPCDARCTCARGPSCDCSCGGANHGTGAVVKVVVSDTSVPVATNAPSIERRDEFRAASAAALSRIRSRYGAYVDDFRNGVWIHDRHIWYAVNQALNALRHARALKSHGGRMKALAAVGNWDAERRSA